MMPEEWPIAAEAADRMVDPARGRGPSRLSTVRADFFLDEDDRLTEQERALMTAMLHDIVETLAHEIGAAAGAAAPSDDTASLAPRLVERGLVDRPGLVALMLRRSDEFRISSTFAGSHGPRRLPLLPKLVSDEDPDIAAAAMALVMARGRRRNGFGQPRIELADLPMADREALAFAVAAGISPNRESDARFAAAAQRVVDSTREEQSLDFATSALVDATDAAGRDRLDLLVQASAEGEVALVAQILSRESGVGPQAAWDHLLNSGEGGLALLARMSGLSRPLAARVIADLGSSTFATSVEDEIGRFDSLTEDEVAAASRHWQLPRDFRAARVALGGVNG